jgi:hypothetical protein
MYFIISIPQTFPSKMAEKSKVLPKNIFFIDKCTTKQHTKIKIIASLFLINDAVKR